MRTSRLYLGKLSSVRLALPALTSTTRPAVSFARDASLGGASPSQRLVVGALGFTQILGYGTSFYLLAILGLPISSDTGWPLHWAIAGLSIGLTPR